MHCDISQIIPLVIVIWVHIVILAVLGQFQNTRPKNTAGVRTVLPAIGMLPRTGKY
jgi:hypothetical protein